MTRKKVMKPKLADADVDDLLQQVAVMDQSTCIEKLRDVSNPPIDFTDTFLESMSLEKLRHVVGAALLQAKRANGS